MSRAAVYSLLSGDSAIVATGCAVYGFHSTEIPGPRPFLIPRWDLENAAFADRGSRRLTVWIYDDGADFTRIDLIAERVKALLSGAVHVTGADGYILTQATWRGDSGDLFDDSYGAIMRNSEFDVVYRKA